MSRTSNFSSFEINLMRQLLTMASKQKGKTCPNPVTASAIVKNDQVISKGAHIKFGTPHAEAIAIKKAGPLAKGADLYVNLEPCTHWGNNPPCTDLIIKAGIKKVVYCTKDPNPKVRQVSAKTILEAKGINVSEGLLKKEALLLNEVFFKNMSLKKPFVTLKAGMSLDGKIALSSGQSKYITSENSIRKVHMLRRENNAIIIGANTLKIDNPCLNVRYNLLKKGFKNPDKIILCNKIDISEKLNIFCAENESKVVFVVPEDIDRKTVLNLKQKADIWFLPLKNNYICWHSLLEMLYKKGYCSILIEGGGNVFTSALEENIIDKTYFFLAPKILGGKNSVQVFGGKGIENLSDALIIKDMKVRYLKPDIMITGYLNHPEKFFL
ncbi:MAG: bifunctional diaminohydroxyphosphoribosylaminopyrimidine deaminase/5-amino-6-(5-phosphoribosylamino)uracil reductase RibD [bacterium]|nr:bifunctional diaminohydroxyphosphoribosylaminopyrimidine deaminase/5-amino-6-(5-phosphoribosylamino)uracil reductase RibD [bacterium]